MWFSGFSCNGHARYCYVSTGTSSRPAPRSSPYISNAAINSSVAIICVKYESLSYHDNSLLEVLIIIDSILCGQAAREVIRITSLQDTVSSFQKCNIKSYQFLLLILSMLCFLFLSKKAQLRTFMLTFASRGFAQSVWVASSSRCTKAGVALCCGFLWYLRQLSL